MSAALIAILLMFVAIMAGVLAVCLRGRRQVTSQAAMAHSGDESNDNRLAVMFFVAILVGAALAVAAALLIF